MHPAPRGVGGGQGEMVNGNLEWAGSVCSLAPASSDFWFQGSSNAAEAMRTGGYPRVQSKGIVNGHRSAQIKWPAKMAK